MSRVMVAMAYSRANNLSKLNHSVKLFMMIAQLCLGVYTVYRKWKLRMLFNFSSASTWLFSCLIYFNCLNSASLLRHQNVYCHVAYLSCSKKEKKWDYYQGLLREKNPLIFPKFWLRHKQKKFTEDLQWKYLNKLWKFPEVRSLPPVFHFHSHPIDYLFHMGKQEAEDVYWPWKSWWWSYLPVVQVHCNKN